jgi:hypothetical protein
VGSSAIARLYAQSPLDVVFANHPRAQKLFVGLSDSIGLRRGRRPQAVAPMDVGAHAALVRFSKR